jgi:two-component system response regulator AlgR
MRILIVDDEPWARERLRQLVQAVPEAQVVGEADNGRDALLRAHDTTADVVLLDIRMPGMDGLEAARHLTASPNPPAVIFTTAYGDYALEAFDAQAVDYLLKPVQQARLEQALGRARRLGPRTLSAIEAARQPSGARTHISAYGHGGIQVVAVSEIRCFQADCKYVTARYPGGEILLDEPLKAIEKEFGDAFLRVHRNALVSLAQARAFAKEPDGYVVRLNGIEEGILVSRRHLPAVRRRLKALGKRAD